MGMKDLDRRTRSKQIVSPHAEPVASPNAIYDRSLSREERRDRGLGHGKWLSWAVLCDIGMAAGEFVYEWVKDPVASAQAANWRIDAAEQFHNSFERFGIHSWHLGWNPIPETRGRVPGMYMDADWAQNKQGNRRRIQVKPSELWDRRRSELEMWVMVNGGNPLDNVAMTIGEACGNVRVWDLDIRDQDLAEAVHASMNEIFGVSPFVRVGSFPKRQVIYRTDDPKLLALVKQAFEMLDANGKPDTIEETDENGKVSKAPRNVIEFLAHGSNFTVYGLHHKTKRFYDWSLGTLHPAIAGPENAPLITAAQVTVFLERLKEIRPFKRRGSSSSNPFAGSDEDVTAFARSDDGRIWVPKISNAKGLWSANEAGLVYDGREPYAAKMAWAFCAANPHMLLNPADLEALRDDYFAFVLATIDGDKIKKKPALVTLKPRWKAVVAKWLPSAKHHAQTGQWLKEAIPYRIREDGTRPCTMHIAPAHRPADGSLDWLPDTGGIIPELAGRSKISGILPKEKSPEQIKLDRECRQLIDSVKDREAIHARVAAEIDAAYDAMLAEVEAYEEYQEAVYYKKAGSTELIAPTLPLHILGGPTGSGKTTRGIRRIGGWCKRNPRKRNGMDFGPMVMAVPTGENLVEALATAERNGMIVPKPELDIDAIREQLEANGVKVAVIRGKKVAGCMRMDEVEMLAKRGMSSARLCGATVEIGDELTIKLAKKNKQEVEKEELLCEFRERGECGYWNQMANAADADIVLVPHSYLTTNGVPKVIKAPRAVFIDESITHRVLHQLRMPITALDVPRPPPWLTQRERDENLNADDIHHQSECAREVAKQALLGGCCPAEDLLKDPRGLSYVEAAVKVCARAHKDAKDVRPDLTAEDVAELTERESGTNLHEETRFWRVVHDRVQALVMDKVEPLPKPRAKGKKDLRLQVVIVTIDGLPQPFVRISWRSKPNWSGAPMMLLDASASPKIMAKVFSREIVRHDITAPLHVRTIAMIDSSFSNSQFIPREGASPDQIEICRFNISRARALITKVAISYSYGMVLVGMAMAVRERIFAADWSAPPNVEVVHFGALRGLDFAKNYVTALSIGRSEQPIHIIDGYKAALTYDDDEPEEPCDKLGTGFTIDGKPIFRVKKERLMFMRTGEDHGLEVPEMPSIWGKELEEQWREEEQRQFVGRLRPVYRMGEAPVWVCMTKCMPEGFIIDDVVALDDTLQDSAVWSVMKRSMGVLAPGLTDRQEWVQKTLDGQSMSEWLTAKLPTDTAFHSRMGQTLHDVRYTVDGKRRQGRIAGWHQDPEAVFMSMAEALGVAVSEVEVKPLVKERIVGERRKPDRLADELVAAREARREAKADAEVKGYVALVHALLPPEEGITVEDLYQRHLGGENIEDLLIGWLHSWHPERDLISLEEVAAEWEQIKATKTTAEIYEIFGIAGRVATE